MNRLLAVALTLLSLIAAVLAVAVLLTPPRVAPPAPPPPTVSAAAPAQVGLPTAVEIAAIGVSETLVEIGLKGNGDLQTPPFGSVGWYGPGPRPGAAGSALIVGHVHRPGEPDVFARLRELRPGDTVTVRRVDGVTTFVITATEQVPKEQLPYDRIWPATDAALLVLVTCAGEPNPVTRVYPDNTIVYARAT